jgi:uncharacterized membrane protein
MTVTTDERDPREDGGRRMAPAVLGILSLLGLGISTYLTVVHYADLPLACSTRGVVDCQAVTRSVYSVIPGTDVPISVLGLLWFAVSGGLALLTSWSIRDGRDERAWLPTVHLVWTVAASLVVLALVYVEIVRLHRLCEWCTAVHVLVLTSMLVAVVRWQDAMTRTDEGRRSPSPRRQQVRGSRAGTATVEEVGDRSGRGRRRCRARRSAPRRDVEEDDGESDEEGEEDEPDDDPRRRSRPHRDPGLRSDLDETAELDPRSALLNRCPAAVLRVEVPPACPDGSQRRRRSAARCQRPDRSRTSRNAATSDHRALRGSRRPRLVDWLSLVGPFPARERWWQGPAGQAAGGGTVTLHASQSAAVGARDARRPPGPGGVADCPAPSDVPLSALWTPAGRLARAALTEGPP